LVFITVVESVYCAVRTEFLYTDNTVRIKRIRFLFKRLSKLEGGCP